MRGSGGAEANLLIAGAGADDIVSLVTLLSTVRSPLH